VIKEVINMQMLDFDNVPINGLVRDIETGEVYEVLNSRPDIDDAINGLRGEIVLLKNTKTLTEHEIYSSRKISTIFEVLETK
jgi:SpoU rRNA methylase family enzyme